MMTSVFSTSPRSRAMRPTLLRVRLLHGGAEFVAFLLPPCHRDSMNGRTRMPALNLYLHAHIRKPVHFQHRRIDHLALKIEATFVGTRWNTKHFTKLGDLHRADTSVKIGPKTHLLIKRDGVFAGHRIGDLAANTAPAVRPGQDQPQTFRYAEQQ